MKEPVIKGAAEKADTVYEFSHPNGHAVKLWIEEDGALSIARDGAWDARLYVGTLSEKVVPSQPDYLWTFVEVLELLTRRYVRRVHVVRSIKCEASVAYDEEFPMAGSVCMCSSCKSLLSI